MDAIEFNGVVEYVSEPNQISGSFTKREVVVKEHNPGAKYPNFIPFEFINDSIEKLNGIKPGDAVTVKGFLNGRLWEQSGERKCFISIRGVSITVQYSGSISGTSTTVQLTGAQQRYEVRTPVENTTTNDVPPETQAQIDAARAGLTDNGPTEQGPTEDYGDALPF